MEYLRIKKECKLHGVVLHVWRKDARRPHGGYWKCGVCKRAEDRKYRLAHPGADTEYSHRTGRKRPMNEARDCSLYLGVYIAERALSRFFDNITRMPMNNPGYDFLCGRGFKIDVKSSCLIHSIGNSDRWTFNINRNQATEYFLLIAFDTREDLNPMHVWLVPSHIIRHLKRLSMPNTTKVLTKWAEYEHPLDRVATCCTEMRGPRCYV